jgi:hypothetical protein
MNNEIEVDEDGMLYDIPKELYEKYCNQKIESKKIARAFLDEDETPLWNKLFTWEAIAQKAGYMVPEKHGNMSTASGVAHWVLSRKVLPALNKAKNMFVEIRIPIVGENSIYYFSAFDSFRNIHNKRLFGFTTDKSLHFNNDKENLTRLIHAKVRFDKMLACFPSTHFPEEFNEKIANGTKKMKEAIAIGYVGLQDVVKTMH